MAAKNNIVRSVAPRSVFPSAINQIDSTISYNQGDFLIFDDSTNLIRKPTLETECNTFLGVAINSVSSGKVVGPYTGIPDAVSSTGVTDVAGPLYGVVVSCTAATGITLAVGDLMYFNPAAGTDGVTNTGTKAIGVYQGKAVSSTTAGQKVDVLLMARFPGDAIKGA